MLNETAFVNTTGSLIKFPVTLQVHYLFRTDHVSFTYVLHVLFKEICNFPELILLQYRAEFPIPFP